MPATGTPEPGGLSWRELIGLMKLVMSKKSVVAADVVELSPIPGFVAPNFLVARLVSLAVASDGGQASPS